MPQYAIYEIRNRIDGRVYVGATRQFKVRVNAHFGWGRRAEKQGHEFYRDIHRLGRDAFEVSVLEECDSLPEAQVAEAKWVAAYGSTDPTKGYNLVPGGNDFKIRAALALKKRKQIEAADPEKFLEAQKERARKLYKSKTPEEWSEIARERMLKRDPEERREMSRRAVRSRCPQAHKSGLIRYYETLTPEQREKKLAPLRAGFAKLTKEQLKERARKTWETRRASKLKT